MTFHLSAEDIRVDDGHILRARLVNSAGEHVDAELNLNDVIGNNDGNFEWGGSGFSDSAQEISFSLEGDDNVPILRANLANIEGEWIGRDINLAECISNQDGSFAFE